MENTMMVTEEAERSDIPLKAEVRVINTIPRLFINGVQTVPTLFFGNTDIGTNVTEQAKLAAEAGIHLHSVIYNLQFEDDYSDVHSYAYTNLGNCMDAILKGDNDAKILLRVNTGAYMPILESDEWTSTDLVQYVDGSKAGIVSTASDRWAEEAKVRLQAIVEFMRSSPKYADHLFGIHLEKGEWFEFGFRESGSDVSAVNDAKFMEWQRVKYGKEYDCAIVPRDLPNNISSDNSYPNTLLLNVEEQRFTDYLDYINDLVSTRIEDFAKTIKEASDNELLVIAFYGYTFELCDSQSGHYALQKLLKSPYLDGFAAPITYQDRTGKNGAMGASSASMTVLDSITRNGKIWFQESDQRTFVNDSPDGGWLPNLPTLESIYEVHKREMGASMLHGNGMWAMDLTGTGWLLDAEIWKNLAQLNAVYEAYSKAQKKTSTFDMVVVVDEAAEAVAGQPSYCVSINLLSNLRQEAYRSGIRCGFAEMQDILDGKFADAKLYVFANPYRLTNDTATKLAEQFQQGGKTAVFLYGFGNLPVDTVKKLTGMTIESIGENRLNMRITDDGKAYGLQKPSTTQSVNPCYAVTAGQSQIFAEYTKGKKTAIALYDGGTYRTIFFGGTYLDKENMQAFAKIANVPVYADKGDIFVGNEDLLVYCASKAGEKTIRFPEAVTVYDYFYDIWYTDTTEVSFSAILGETRYFFYGEKHTIENLHLPHWK